MVPEHDPLLATHPNSMSKEVSVCCVLPWGENLGLLGPARV